MIHLLKRLARSKAVMPRIVNPDIEGSNPSVPAIISRRQFLAYAGAAALVIPTVKYFLPPAGGWIYRSNERLSLGFTDWRGIYGTSDGVALNSVPHPVDPRFVSDVEWYLPEDAKRELFHTHPEDDNSPIVANNFEWDEDAPRLSESSLENLFIEIRDAAEAGNYPMALSPGRRWWKA